MFVPLVEQAASKRFSSYHKPGHRSPAMGDAADRSKGKRLFVQFVAVFSAAAILCILLYASRFPMPVPYGATAFFGPRGAGNSGALARLDNQVNSSCSSLPDHAICCDRSDENSDVCFMSGDVRTDAASLSLLLFPPRAPAPGATPEEEEEKRIRPYTRKWDGNVMGDIQEVRLCVARPGEADAPRCDVRHDAPVHVVTAGGYNGNYFHAFNDGFLPSWVTVQHLRRRVVLAVLSYSPRWAGAYREVISGLSGYPVIDLLRDRRTHCFPGAIVGTRFHGYLAVDPARLRDNKTIVDFHRFLAGVYEPSSSQSQGGGEQAERAHRHQQRRPRLGILLRRGTRVIENRAAVARLAASVGFDVDVLESGDSTMTPRLPLSAVYAWVRAHDALVGVHGSDLTSFMFLRPGSGALAQIAPLGVTQLAHNLFGTPAVRMGLHYEQYDVRGSESSLSRVYSPDHVVVADPERAKRRQGSTGEWDWDWDWDFIGRVYLNGQNVSLDLARFGETLARMNSRLLLQRQREGTE